MTTSSSNEDPNHSFFLPHFILSTFLWASRFLIIFQLIGSGEPILNIIMSLICYYVCIDIGVSFIMSFIKYIPFFLKDPSSFIGMSHDQIKTLVSKDKDFISLVAGMRIFIYLIIYFYFL